MNRLKIGLYGGTFDPVHHAHLILARDALEQLGLDRLIFIPNQISPHKQTTEPAPAADRLAMLEAAIVGEPRFALDDLELRREPPSYTIETLRELTARHPGAEFFFLIGQDNLAELATWREIEEVTRLAQFVVFHRGDEPGQHPYRTLSRRVELSATEVRARVANGLSIRYWVPEEVARIIAQRSLYLEKIASKRRN